MNPRTTKGEVEAVFARLCATVGTPIGGKFDLATRTMSRGWSLDNNPTYGGYVVVGHSGEGTGESRPLGHHRMPPREFVAAMNMAIQAVEAAREQQ